MAVAAARQVALTAGPDDVIVVLLPDGGRGYLSKVFDDNWMRSYGFLQDAEELTLGDVLLAKTGDLPTFVHMHPTETVRESIDVLREFGVSQVPVVRAEPPLMAAEVVGSVSERALLDALFAGRAHLSDRVEEHMSPPLPMVGAGVSVTNAVASLETSDALIVLDGGQPIGVVTRQDVLAHLAL